MNQASPVAVVTGVGPGTGAAIARRFARGGYAVAMLARNGERLTQLEQETLVCTRTHVMSLMKHNSMRRLRQYVRNSAHHKC